MQPRGQAQVVGSDFAVVEGVSHVFDHSGDVLMALADSEKLRDSFKQIETTQL